VATLPPAPGVLKVQLHWTVGLDTTCFNTFHLKFAGSGPSNADCVTLAGTVYADVQATLILSTHPSVILDAVTVTDLSDPAAGIGTHTGTAPGTAGGGPLPANCCVLVNYTVQRRYRGGKPRSYIPMGTDTDLQNPQTFAAASVTNFGVRMNALITDMLGLTWGGGNVTQLVQVSYVGGHTWSQNNPPNGPWKSHPVYRTTPQIDQLTSTVVNPTVGTQRRRVRGKR